MDDVKHDIRLDLERKDVADEDATRCNLLSLPYDIRFLIYQHLFHDCSPGKQIYVQAAHSGLIAITEQRIPIHILAVSRQMYQDAGGYLYNNKIFNIVGSRFECLDKYQLLRDVIAKHATDEVHVDCFSNGDHSSTGCISLYTGEAKKTVLDRRDRGVHVTMSELREEAARGKHEQQTRRARQHRRVMRRHLRNVGQIALGLLVVFSVPLLDHMFDIAAWLDQWFAALYASLRERWSG